MGTLRKKLALLSASCLLFTCMATSLSFAPAAAAADVDDRRYAPPVSAVVPTRDQQTSWWGGEVWAYSINADGGLRIESNHAVSGVAHSVGLTQQYALDGLHLKMKIDWTKGGSYVPDYFDRILYMSFTNTARPANAQADGLTVKLDMSAGQLQLMGGGEALLNLSALIHTDNALELEIRARENGDGSWTLTFNGVDLAVSADYLSGRSGTTNMDALCVSFWHETNYGNTRFDILGIHDGSEVCLDTDGHMVDAGPHNAANSMLYPNANSGWGWPVAYTDLEGGGTRVSFQGGANSFAYRERLGPYSLDGLHMRMRVNSTDYWNRIFHLMLSSGGSVGDSGNIDGTLQFKFDMDGGQIFGFADKQSLDHSQLEGYTPSVATNRVFVDFLKTTSDLELRFSSTEDGGLLMLVNDAYRFIVSAEELQKAGGLTDLSNVYVYLTPDVDPSAGFLDYTIYSIHGGESVCYDDGYADVKAAMEAIDAIGTVTAQSGAAIRAARRAYDALSPELQALVDNYSVLEAAEAVYDDLTGTYLDEGYYPVSSSMLIPNENSGWGWPVTYTNLENGGVRIAFASDTPGDLGIVYRHQFRTPVALDGMHLKMTVNAEAYADRQFNLMLTSETGKDSTSGTLAFKIDMDGGQIYGSANGAALVHEGRPGYNASYPDRVFVDVFQGTDDVEIRAAKNDDGGYTISFNGYDFVLSSEEIARAIGLTDPSNVYLYLTPNGGNLDVSLLSYHGGEAPCYDDLYSYGEAAIQAVQDVTQAIEDIGTVTTQSGPAIAAARRAYDSLEARLQPYVTNLSVLEEAEERLQYLIDLPYTDNGHYPVSDSMLLPNASSPFAGWKVDYTNLPDGGVRVDYNFDDATGLNIAHRHQFRTPAALDGLHLKMTLNSDVYEDRIFNLMLHSSSGRENAQGALLFKVDMDGGQISGQIGTEQGGEPLDHTGRPGYNGTDSKVVFVDELKTTDVLEIRAVKNADGGYTVSFNDYDFVLSAEEITLATGLTDLSNVYLYLTPMGGNLDVSLLSYHGGEDLCYDELFDYGMDAVRAVEAVMMSIDAIGNITSQSGPAVEAARAAYEALAPALQKYVTNLSVLTEAEKRYQLILDNPYRDGGHYPVTDSMLYPNSTLLPGWGWQVTHTELEEGGVRVSYTAGGMSYTHRHQFGTAVRLDGLHLKMAVNGTEYNDRIFTLMLSALPSKGNPDAAGTPDITDTLIFRIDPDGGQIYGRVGAENGKTQGLDHSHREGFNSDYPDRVFIDAFKDSDEIEIRAFENDDGSYTIRFNYYDFVLTTEELTSAGLADASEVYLYIVPENNYLDYTLTSFHGGESVCYDDLYEEFGAEGIQAIDATIEAIQSMGAITTQSGDVIVETRAEYEALPDALKALVTNLETLEAAEKAYAKLTDGTLDLDSTAYAPSVDNVGPTHHWPQENADWTTAAQGTGVTLAFRSTDSYTITVQNVGLHTHEKLSLDGLHIEFDNLAVSGNGYQFALIFAGQTQMDLTNPGKNLWLNFYALENRLAVTVNAAGMGTGYTVIDSLYLTREQLAEPWDVRLDANEDGSYTLSVGPVSGIIPADYIRAAADSGLDFSASCVTFGMGNMDGNTPANLSVDVLAIHGGTEPCFRSVSQTDADAVEAVIARIDAIGDDITAASKEAIEAARNAYDALPEAVRGLVSNYQTLQDAEASYALIASDLAKAQVVIDLIDAIGTPVTLESRDAIIEALRAYTDLFPRIRAYVTNYDKLMAAREAYEKLDPDADFDAWLFEGNMAADVPGEPGGEEPQHPADTGENTMPVLLMGMVLLVAAAALVICRKRKAFQ